MSEIMRFTRFVKKHHQKKGNNVEILGDLIYAITSDSDSQLYYIGRNYMLIDDSILIGCMPKGKHGDINRKYIKIDLPTLRNELRNKRYEKIIEDYSFMCKSHLLFKFGGGRNIIPFRKINEGEE